MAHATAVPGRRPPVWRRRPSRPANATLALLGILLLAAAIRAVWVVCVARQPLGTHDPAFYISAAEQLSQGKGYHYFDQGTTAYFPPGRRSLHTVPFGASARARRRTFPPPSRGNFTATERAG